MICFDMAKSGERKILCVGYLLYNIGVRTCNFAMLCEGSGCNNVTQCRC